MPCTSRCDVYTQKEIFQKENIMRRNMTNEKRSFIKNKIISFSEINVFQFYDFIFLT